MLWASLEELAEARSLGLEAGEAVKLGSLYAARLGLSAYQRRMSRKLVRKSLRCTWSSRFFSSGAMLRAMSVVKFETFKQLDIRVGKVLSAERVKRSEKLILLRVDVGGEEKQIVAGLAPHYAPEQLIGKSIVVIVNLEPRTIMGYVSQGMLLAAVEDDKPVLLVPEKEVRAGARVT